MKKVIKAHQGMAHIPKPSNQQAPSKAKGTAGTTPRPKRMIGLPQRFRGGRRRPTAAAPQAPPTVRPTRAMLEPAVIQQPKPVVRPPIQSDAGGGRGEGRRIRDAVRPIQKPKTGSVKAAKITPSVGRPRPSRPASDFGKTQNILQRAKAEQQAQQNQLINKQNIQMAQPRIMKQGGYVSRAKYGIVDNIKKGK